MSTTRKNELHADEWQLQEAKNRLSRVVEEARRGKPQTITLRGTPAAVVLSFEQYQELTRPRLPLSEFFKSSPLRGVELELERSRDTGREVEL
ncbi:type II toxin-antitoxin system Phd/YefM family antitoxin [Trichloromonas acetexigens]|uniref:Antitoxin n=1 Tax=Trichloromonas acetexigens TaxID=38815 RepID=A0A550J7L4_9BACT|nr:type II toxin-antitoxin system Phd/YefM family antitoxin [Desulfuromonas acetexigens]TRO79123.1 type II toxin-antitoxin system Phd/YefM family antitoxin [Desulfuromonas acetexigens]